MIKLLLDLAVNIVKLEMVGSFRISHFGDPSRKSSDTIKDKDRKLCYSRNLNHLSKSIL